MLEYIYNDFFHGGHVFLDLHSDILSIWNKNKLSGQTLKLDMKGD